MASVRSSDHGWYLLDDGHEPVLINPDSLVDERAYMLFYVKRASGLLFNLQPSQLPPRNICADFAVSRNNVSVPLSSGIGVKRPASDITARKSGTNPSTTVPLSSSIGVKRPVSDISARKSNTNPSTTVKRAVSAPVSVIPVSPTLATVEPVTPITPESVNLYADAALPVRVAANHIYNVVGDAYPARTAFIVAPDEQLYREKQHTPFCLWHALNAIVARPGCLVSLALARCVYHLASVNRVIYHTFYVENWRKRQLEKLANPERRVPDEVQVVGEDLVIVGEDPVPTRLIHPNGFGFVDLRSLLGDHGVSCSETFDNITLKRPLISLLQDDRGDCGNWLNFGSPVPVAGLILHKGWHFTALRCLLCRAYLSFPLYMSAQLTQTTNSLALNLKRP